MQDLDKFIWEFLRSPKFNQELLEREFDFEPPVTLTYAIERLIITHVKLFMLEDKVRDKFASDEEIGRLKRTIDFWNGVQRPRLVAAIGDILSKAVYDNHQELIQEPNLKDYKPRETQDE